VFRVDSSCFYKQAQCNYRTHMAHGTLLIDKQEAMAMAVFVLI
jgi:hypothetical protein